MSRRSLTLAFTAVLVVALAAIAALLPVPYVALRPGPVTNTLGSVGGTELIRIEGRPTYPDKGRLDLTTVSVVGGPPQRLDLVTALAGWVDDAVTILPEEQVYPEGQTPKQVERASRLEMRESQENATTAALRHLGIPVDTEVLVHAVQRGLPAEGKLRKGDQLLQVDGTVVVGGAQLRDLITAHDPGEPVRIVVERDGRRVPTTVRTTEAPDGRAIVGVQTIDRADYPFTVEISLEDVGGPSAGLMFALGIVDKLTPGSLTGGEHVAGTGAIDDGGRVDPIGGITQKMIAAEEAGASVFLVPPGNCAEAVRTAPDGLRLVKASNLSAAVEALEMIREGKPDAAPRC